MADDQLVYPFKYLDPIRKRWVAARFKARRDEIAKSYEKWEITGPGEERRPGGQFMPPTV